MDAPRCPAERTLDELATGGLSPDGRAAVLAHAADCPACAARLSKGPAGAIEATADVGTAPGAPALEDVLLPRGASIGRYLVLDKLGDGGMGVVYAAYDSELHRKVAVKLLRNKKGARPAEAATAQQRMLREAQALARLSHPNVISVFDVGTYGERVFMAMELVEGTTLRERFTRERPAWREVVRWFVEAGRGLQAAHQAGLIHRDFKPDNVLVGGDGRVRVMDFGLARQAEAPAEDEATAPLDLEPTPRSPNPSLLEVPLTRAGLRMGTLQYMAPEQHQRAGDERSDQFSFCVSLYEALYGARPFRVERLSPQSTDWRLPPAPRGVRVPAHLRRLLARGLSPEPERRFGSMAQLLAELSRDPIAARRRWGAASAVGLVALTALGASWRVASGRQAACSGGAQQLASAWDEGRRAQVERALLGTGVPYAAQTWERVQAGLDDYARGWAGQYAEACEATSVRKEQSAEVLDLRMGCLQRAKVELSSAVEVLAAADPAVLETAVKVVAGLPPLARCADVEALRQAVPAPRDLAEQRQVTQVRAELSAAAALENAGRYEQALARAAAAEAQLASLAYRPVHAEVLLRKGSVLLQQGQFPAAEAALHQAFTIGLEVGALELAVTAGAALGVVVGERLARPAEGLWLGETALGLSGRVPGGRAESLARQALASVHERRGKYEEAEAQLRRALELSARAAGAESLDAALVRNSLAIILYREGHYPEAEAEHRRVLALRQKLLGADHPLVAQSMANLGSTLQRLGREADAEVQMRAALVLRERVLGAEHPDVAHTLHILATLLADMGRLDEAEAAQRRALAIREKLFGEMHPSVTQSLNNLAYVLQNRGQYGEAERTLLRVVALREKMLGPEHPDLAQSLALLGVVQRNGGKLPQAEESLRRGLVLGTKALGPEHPLVAQVHHELGLCLSGRGRYAEAEAEERTALALHEKRLGPEHLQVATVGRDLALLLVKQGRPAEALALARRALKIAAAPGVAPRDRAELAFPLAKVLWAAGERTEALARAREASAGYTQPEDAPRRTAVEQWLAQRSR